KFVDEVFVFDARRRFAASAATLRLIRGDGLRLGITAVRQRDDDVLLLDQIFDRQIGVVLDDLGPARIGVLRTNLLELGANDAQQTLGPSENVSEILNLSEQVLELLPDFVLLQSGETV